MRQRTIRKEQPDASGYLYYNIRSLLEKPYFLDEDKPLAIWDYEDKPIVVPRGTSTHQDIIIEI